MYVTWVQPAFQVLFARRRFYARLRLRTSPGAATSVAVRNLVAIGIVATAWTAIMMLMTTDWRWFNLEEFVGGSLMAGLCVPLACWLGYRLIGAIVITVWIFCRSLPDTRWAAKVLAYESTFLWAFCAFWVLLATSFALYKGMWISDVFGTGFFYAVFGVPAEAVVTLGGTGLLGLLWLWRYRIALRAIRWSNF